jgi:N-acetylmuramoyl-L-alanine amidase
MNNIQIVFPGPHSVCRGGLAALLAVALAACTPAPVRTTIPSTWQPSPNFDSRRPNYVVIHHTSDENLGVSLDTLTDPQRAVSSHYLIGRDGQVYQLVDERKRAWHAGKSYWGGDTDINSSSIGIELDNNGEEPFDQRQITALLALLTDIAQRYPIPPANYLAHADVAPARKNDPSRLFPWRTLADHGFGLWCHAPPAAAPPAFDTTMALLALGYDVSDLNAAIQAFKLHYVQDDVSPVLRESDVRVLSCLLQRKQHN